VPKRASILRRMFLAALNVKFKYFAAHS
jgi:hypothetical protein